MKHLLLSLLLVIAAPALAQFSFSTPSGDSCTVACAKGSTPPPPPPPADPPSTGCATSGFVLRPLGAQGQSTRFVLEANVTYTSPLPAGAGIFGMTSAPDTPGGQLVEVGISKCAGDLGYYKTPVAQYLQFGSMQVPCGGTYNPESPGVKWGATKLAWDTICIVPAGATWYVNYRATGTGPLMYFWNPR